MQLLYASAIYFLAAVIIQCTAQTANRTTRQALLSNFHSTSADQSLYPDNPIMLESPSHFALPHQIRKQYPIEEYIVGGYSKWGGYDREMFQPDGSVILEFDMKITREEYSAYYSGDDNSLVQSSPPLDSPLPRRNLKKSRNKRVKRKALFRAKTHWPGAVIPYQITVDFSPREVQIVKESMKAWEDRTCIRFVPAQAHHQNLLTVQSQRGCNSFIGMVGGVQQLNLEKDCRVQHVITHELGHVIGLIHEHQRPDRDGYIRVVTQNVDFNKMKNFRKFQLDRVSNYGVEYDYTSIMHYGKLAFSKDDKGITMATVDSRFQDIIGHATTISFADAKGVNLMYGCARSCGAAVNMCGSGYLNHKCQCVCKDGTQSCRQRIQPIRRPFINRVTGQRPTRQRNIFFPAFRGPVVQRPNPYTNLFQPRGHNSLIRHIFQPGVRGVIHPRPFGLVRPRSMLRNLVHAPVKSTLTRNTVYTPAQIQTSAQIPQTAGQTFTEEAYKQNEAVPTEPYDMSRSRLTKSLSHNQQSPVRYVQSPVRYVQRTTQWNPYQVQQSMMLARSPSQAVASNNVGFAQRHVIARTPVNVQILPGFIRIQ